MKEADAINTLRDENEEFKKIAAEHKKLEISLADIDKKKYLSPADEMLRKNIQKQKLHFKDKMANLVRAHR